MSHVIKENGAILNDYRYDPLFGDGDLVIFSFNIISYCSKYSYEKRLETEGNFYVDECEVFQIVYDSIEINK